MSWITINIQLKKGAIFSPYGDSALIFRDIRGVSA